MVVGYVQSAVDDRRHPLLPQQVDVLRRPAVSDVDAASLRRRVDQIQWLVLLRVTLEVWVDPEPRPEISGLLIVVQGAGRGRLTVHCL